MKALLLGAGASFEIGMPLVWELTCELKNWLTPQKLELLNEGWEKQGGGYRNDVISLVNELLRVDSMHYENLIGSLEVETNRERNINRYQELHGIRNWILEMIYWLLHERQIKNGGYILSVIKDMYGIVELVKTSKPLWVFSLNHDIHLEIIAAEYKIPLKSGFTSFISLPARDESGNIIERINFEYLSRKDINNNNYDFFNPGEYGINLIKLHGALDIFAKGDEHNFIKIKPNELNCNGYLSALKNCNSFLRYHPFVKVTNEIAYADDANYMQFLRRSLLSGAHKFTGKISQILPPEFLKLISHYINYSNEIICIGYGFGDSHIDDILKNWLSFSNSRKMEIVNPNIDSIPSSFSHLCRKIKITNLEFLQYILSFNSSKDYYRRKLLRFIRKRNRNKLMRKICRS